MIDWENNFKDFYFSFMARTPWVINKMGNQSLFIDTILTAISHSGYGAIDNLAIEDTIGEVKGTHGK